MDRPIKRMSATTLKITAGKLVVDAKTVLDNASLIVQNGHIIEIGSAEKLRQVKTDRVINLPEHIVHPGFVNAHCHLDLSCLHGKLKAGKSFTGWVCRLVAKRSGCTMRKIDHGIKNGIIKLVSTGTTCVGDISSVNRSLPILAHSGMRAVVFHEILGYAPEIADERFNQIAALLKSQKDSSLIKNAISPHAIYSVSPQLFKKVTAYARKQKLSVAIHMAETKEEIEFSKKGRGPFRELLVSFGVFAPGRYPKANPIDALENLNSLKKSLLIHANHISGKNVDKIKLANAKVVICPNSNRWFKRPISAPVYKLFERGVPLSLGTDSLASNYKLDMAGEVREFHKNFPDIPLADVFDMATRGGAIALGLKNGAGRLTVKAPFDAVAIKMPKTSGKTDLIKAIISPRRKTGLVWINGIVRYKNMENIK